MKRRLAPAATSKHIAERSEKGEECDSEEEEEF